MTERHGPMRLADLVRSLPIRAAGTETETGNTEVSFDHRPWPTGVPESKWELVPDGVRKALMAAINGNKWPVFMTGDVGTGKSCAAACVYRGWRRPALWYRASEIVADVLTCRTNGKGFVVRTRGETSWDEWEAGIMRKITEASLVVFDDVGLRQPSPAAYEVFYLMVEARTGKPTIYTSNLNAEELGSVYDERIVSRLLRGARIRVSGDDRRIAQGETLHR